MTASFATRTVPPKRLRACPAKSLFQSLHVNPTCVFAHLLTCSERYASPSLQSPISRPLPTRSLSSTRAWETPVNVAQRYRTATQGTRTRTALTRVQIRGTADSSRPAHGFHAATGRASHITRSSDSRPCFVLPAKFGWLQAQAPRRTCGRGRKPAVAGQFSLHVLMASSWNTTADSSASSAGTCSAERPSRNRVGHATPRSVKLLCSLCRRHMAPGGPAGRAGPASVPRGTATTRPGAARGKAARSLPGCLCMTSWRERAGWRHNQAPQHVVFPNSVVARRPCPLLCSRYGGGRDDER